MTQDGDIPWIWLVNIDHLYWSRDGLKVAEQKIHPHGARVVHCQQCGPMELGREDVGATPDSILEKEGQL